MSSKGKEIYKYSAPWPLYSAAWSLNPEHPFRLAIGSFVEEYCNKVQIVKLNEDLGAFKSLFTFDHPYPSTKIMWIPDFKGIYPDILATSGDYLRIWRIVNSARKDDKDFNSASGVRLETLLNVNKKSDYCAPLTSFDWNETDPSLIGTSSIDTTCTIWNIETGTPICSTPSKNICGRIKTQLIAHDKEVYDIAFSRAGGGRDMFASVGGDASVRMFDLRHMEHSTIVWEDSVDHVPILRLAWNKEDPNYLATLSMESRHLVILDIRMPCSAVTRLSNHLASINAMCWAPHSGAHICSAADDHKAMIWDIHHIANNSVSSQAQNALRNDPQHPPILAYSAPAEINQIQWGKCHPDWISICYENCLEMLRV